MRSFIFLPIVLILTGCVTAGDVAERAISPVQNYRLSGNEKSMQISGSLERVYEGNSWKGDYRGELKVYFDNQLVIKGFLEDHYIGEVNGFWGKKQVSSNCSSKRVSETSVNVSCIVFIENERSVTLTF